MYIHIYLSLYVCAYLLTGGNLEYINRDFSGGAMFKNPPANAGDIGSIPGPGRSHMLWSN